MMQILLIGISAGVAAALLHASLFSGSLMMLVVIYVLPLPILIAGIGWNYTTGLIAALVAVLGVGVMLGGIGAAAYAINVALPAWWLAYLVLLGRPARTPAGEAMEWYPPGQIVLWSAAVGVAASVTLLVAFLGPDFESIKSNLRSMTGAIMKLQGDEAEAEKILDLDAFMKIAAALMSWALTAVFIGNTWLAAKIVQISGRLQRPWPDLSALHIPSFLPLIFAGALAGILLPDLPGMFAALVAGALIVVFAVQGLAVVHVVTRNFNARPFVLGFVYAALVFFVWPALFLTLLGLADTAIDLRGRSIATRGPPSPQ